MGVPVSLRGSPQSHENTCLRVLLNAAPWDTCGHFACSKECKIWSPWTQSKTHCSQCKTPLDFSTLWCRACIHSFGPLHSLVSFPADLSRAGGNLRAGRNSISMATIPPSLTPSVWGIPAVGLEPGPAGCPWHYALLSDRICLGHPLGVDAADSHSSQLSPLGQR